MLQNQTGTMDPINEEIKSPLEGTTPEESTNQAPTEKVNDKEAQATQYQKELLALIAPLPSPDEKLRAIIDLMESTLSQSGTPQFKRFWEARKLAVELFKDNINPSFRSELWTKYGELTKQARALKDILDEQSSFACEQIEIAIQSLESEVSKIQSITTQEAKHLSFSFPKALKEKQDEYLSTQTELNLLNAAASRINALRKELIKTEMRIKQKNKFFQRLSSIGDSIFPRRKELIKFISQSFQADVDAFIRQHFSGNSVGVPFHILREEIKLLQTLAKSLTLNTQVFTSTRLSMSQCWDKIKDEEKERKKTRVQQKAIYKENSIALFELIGALDSALKEGTLHLDEAFKQLDDITKKIRQTELGREEVKELKEALHKCQVEIQSRKQREEDVRLEKKNEQDRINRQKFIDLKSEIEQLIEQAPTLDHDHLHSNRDAVKEKIRHATLNKVQRMELDPLLRQIGDLLTLKRETALMMMSDDDRTTMNNLVSVHEQRLARRREIKAQLDNLRKAASASGLDFEQSINLTTQIEEEKQRFEQATEAVAEIEMMIDQLKKKQGA